VKPADELEELAPLHPAVEPRVLVKVAQAAAKLRLVQANLHPGDRCAAGGGSGEPGQDPDRRRLARTIRAQQAEDRAARHHKVEPIKGEDRPELLREPAGLDRRPGRRPGHRGGRRGGRHDSSRPATK
jgi:hypothetical protein